MVGRGVVRVLRKPRYVYLAGVTAAGTFTLAVLTPHVQLISQIITSAQLSGGQKITFVFSLFGSITTNFTPISATVTIIIALLFGLNIALLTYYIRRRQTGRGNLKGNTATLAGLISGAFGIGCAACGTVILTAVLSIVGGAGLLAMLPLHGTEFGLLGILLLGYSVRVLAQRVDDPLVCPVD